MFNPDKTVENMQPIIDKILKELSKSKDANEKLQLSQTILNLIQGQSVYLDFITEMMDSDLGNHDFIDDENFKDEH